MRLRYLALALITVGVGLSVHVYGWSLSPAWRDVLGDALWAAMIYWFVAAAAPSVSTGVRAPLALGICWAVEFGQLVHLPVLDAMRATTAGHLVLGSGFDTRDLASYAAGIAVAMTLESLMRPR
jgi:hypothetical protein